MKGKWDVDAGSAVWGLIIRVGWVNTLHGIYEGGRWWARAVGAPWIQTERVVNQEGLSWGPTSFSRPRPPVRRRCLRTQGTKKLHAKLCKDENKNGSGREPTNINAREKKTYNKGMIEPARKCYKIITKEQKEMKTNQRDDESVLKNALVYGSVNIHFFPTRRKMKNREKWILRRKICLSLFDWIAEGSSSPAKRRNSVLSCWGERDCEEAEE